MYTSVYIMHILSAQAINSFPDFKAFSQANSNISFLKLDKNCSRAVYLKVSLFQTSNLNQDQLIICVRKSQIAEFDFLGRHFHLSGSPDFYSPCFVYLYPEAESEILALPLDFYGEFAAFGM